MQSGRNNTPQAPAAASSAAAQEGGGAVAPAAQQVEGSALGPAGGGTPAGGARRGKSQRGGRQVRQAKLKQLKAEALGQADGVAGGGGASAAGGGGGAADVEVGLYADIKRFEKAAAKRRRLGAAGEGGAPRARGPPRVKFDVKERPICRFYKLGKCGRGEACNFLHVGGAVTRLLPCSQFWAGGGGGAGPPGQPGSGGGGGSCSRGAACPYSHDRAVGPCVELVLEGVCHRGVMCSAAHDALAPADVDALRHLYAAH